METGKNLDKQGNHLSIRQGEPGLEQKREASKENCLDLGDVIAIIEKTSDKTGLAFQIPGNCAHELDEEGKV